MPVGREPSVRRAEEADIEALASIWYEGWHDAHARILPAALTRIRTLQSFRDRLRAAVAETRVAGAIDEPAGFCMVKGDQLYQLYVCARARGSGIAAVLMADAEARLAESGFELAWLACAIGNERAARFYEKCGWRRSGVVVYPLESPDGTIALDVWRYEKRLDAPRILS